jgi:hypothetical protein
MITLEPNRVSKQNRVIASSLWLMKENLIRIKLFGI